MFCGDEAVLAIRSDDTDRPGWRIAKVVALPASFVVSAYLMSLAIASPEHWWLGWIALLPLFQAIRVLHPVRAMGCGVLWGTSLYALGTMVIHTGITPGVGSLLLLSLVPGVYAYAGASLTRQVGFSPLLLALGWVGVELALRPLGLRHGLLASTLGNSLVIRTIGSLAGYVLVAFLVAYFNAALLSVLSDVAQKIRTERFIPRGSDDSRRPFIAVELPCDLSYLTDPLRPRAPPCLA